jgi:hypothetical protein
MDIRNFWKHKVETALVRPPLAYLAELKEVMTDPAVRKGYTLRTVRKLGWTIDEEWKYTLKRKDLAGQTHAVFTVFGCLENEVLQKIDSLESMLWTDTHMRSMKSGYMGRRWEWSETKWRVWGKMEVCGIEILGLRPNATNHTYSYACDVTLAELRQACKDNGIKVGGKKKTEIIHALMKV